MSEHLSDDAVRGLLAGTLSAGELLAAGDHLEQCAACRERAATRGDAERAATALTAAVGAPPGHVSDDDLQACVDGSAPAAVRAAVEAHAAGCAVCAEQLRDLREWTAPRRASLWTWAAAAAAALVLAAALGWLPFRGPSRAEALPGLDALAPAAQAQVRAALDAGVASPPPLLAALAGRREELMGASPAASAFALVTPVATAVASDRPRFEWTALAGAESYAVTVADESLRPVASSGPLTATSWTPDVPLPRGRSYAWQVTARRGSSDVAVPAAPAPPARFAVIDADTAARLAAAERAHPTSRLLLGIASLQAGLVDDARRHLRAVPADDPGAGVAQRTLAALDAPRP